MKPGVGSKRLLDKKLVLERKMLGMHQVLTLTQDLCVGCGVCAITCPEEAPKLSPATIEDGRLIKKAQTDLDTGKCTFCGLCVVLCPTNAIQIEVNGKQSVRVVDAKVFPTLTKEIEVNLKKCKTTCNLVCQNDCPTKALEVTVKRADNGKIREIQKVEVDGKLCIFCKRCESICPQNAIRVAKPFYGSLEIDTNLCPEACQVCIDACPTKAILLSKSGKPKVEERFCIYCGACREVCPKKAISLLRTQVLHTDISSGTWIAALEKLTSRLYLAKELASKTQKKLREATQNIGRS